MAPRNQQAAVVSTDPPGPNPLVAELEARVAELEAQVAALPVVIASVTVTEAKRGNRDAYFVAENVLDGDIKLAIREALKTAPPGDVTFILSLK